MSDELSRELADKIRGGWKMLQNNCPICNTILLREKGAVNNYCCQCKAYIVSESGVQEQGLKLSSLDPKAVAASRRPVAAVADDSFFDDIDGEESHEAVSRRLYEAAKVAYKKEVLGQDDQNDVNSNTIDSEDDSEEEDECTDEYVKVEEEGEDWSDEKINSYFRDSDRQEPRESDIAATKMGGYMLSGWCLTDVPCPVHISVPMMMEPAHVAKGRSRDYLCVLCEKKISADNLRADVENSANITENAQTSKIDKAIQECIADIREQSTYEDEDDEDVSLTYDELMNTIDTDLLKSRSATVEKLTEFMSQGWKLLNLHCECGVPLLESEDKKDVICVMCDEIDASPQFEDHNKVYTTANTASTPNTNTNTSNYTSLASEIAKRSPNDNNTNTTINTSNNNTKAPVLIPEESTTYQQANMITVPTNDDDISKALAHLTQTLLVSANKLDSILSHANTQLDSQPDIYAPRVSKLAHASSSVVAALQVLQKK